MQAENSGDFIRQLRELAEMPLRKLAASLDIDQSTLSKLEHGEPPVSRQMLPIIAKTFKVDEKELVIKLMSKQVAYQLEKEKYAKDILIAAEEEIKIPKPQKTVKNNGLTMRKLKTPGQLFKRSLKCLTEQRKTLVYIKTIYKLYKHYAFTKFIILVPSIAIRQGTLRTSSSMRFQIIWEKTQTLKIFLCRKIPSHLS